MNKIYNILSSTDRTGKHFYALHILPLFLLTALLIITVPLFATEKDSFKEAIYGVLPSNTVGQVFSMPSDGKAVVYTIGNCNDDNQFINDGDILYGDAQSRKDTLTICPQNQWQGVKAIFSAFDLSSGDVLAVYDGDLQAMRNGTASFINSASGYGASAAFGAWVKATCDPSINPSGCLTFTFSTNGDFNKGTGWDAWVTCEDRDIQLSPPSITSKLNCSNYFDVLTIGGLQVNNSCGTSINDDILVEVFSSDGQDCVNAIVSKSKGKTVTQTFAIGNYAITYTLQSDPTKTKSTVFSVGQPSLVCNDRVNISLGASCSTALTPDMFTENSCEPIPGIMYYDITVKNASGKVIAKGGKNGDYPQITKDMINLCGSDIYTAEITRVYFDDFTPAYCNNGVLRYTCHTEIDFQDKTPPIFAASSNQTDVIYNCDVVLSDEGLKQFKPVIIDNCSYKEATFFNAIELSPSSSCDKSYLITWRAEDQCGNTSYLDSRLEIRRPGLDKIIKVPNVYLSCGEDTQADVEDFSKTGILGLKVGYEKNGTFYSTDTLALSTTDYVCSYILIKKDQQFPSSCGSKTLRVWELLDWCNSAAGTIAIDDQLIEFIDTLSPTIQCTPHASLETAESISLPPYQCATTPNFLAPSATDICDPSVNVLMFSVERQDNQYWTKLGSNLSQAGDLGLGTYRVGWRAFDKCPNQIKEDTCYRYFVLEDKTSPSAICADQLNVSIGNDYARINAAAIDGGSSDACGIAQYFIRRTACGDPTTWAGEKNTYIEDALGYNIDPTGWDEHIQIECCDLHQTVKLELLVIDNKGNYNSCNVNINPEDKLSPTCSPLPAQSHFCDELHSGELGFPTDKNGNANFDHNEWTPLTGDLLVHYNQTYGDPVYSCNDNLACNDLSIEQEYQLLDLNCGQLSIKRRYRAVDWKNNTSSWTEQTVTVNYRANWTITFPTDWTGTCGGVVPDSDIQIQKGACDKLAYEVKDQVFQTTAGACYKVIRTFTIINWCQYDPNKPVYEVSRIEQNNGIVTTPQTISSTTLGSYSQISYTQLLEVRDTEAPVVSVAEVKECIVGEGCDGIKTFSVTATDCNEASTIDLVYNWEIFENNFSKGSGTGYSFQWTVKAGIPYFVKWYVYDQCGNSAWEARDYVFKDCKKPTPYCLSGLAISLDDNGEVAIWGNDFNLGSYDNCTAQKDLDIRLYHDLVSDRPTTLEQVQQLEQGVAFNCNHIGTQYVSVYVIDQTGNWDFCTTTVVIQNNQNVCAAAEGQVAGYIYKQDGTAVEQTEIYVEGTGNMPTPYMTSANGAYDFRLNMGGSYTIRPVKDINPLNGVSTLDLVLMSKHILAIDEFNSPYQYIAADVNKSNSVTAFDIVILRKLILGILDDFPIENTSWRFIPTNFEFITDIPLKEEFPESILVEQLPGQMSNLDFVAVKVGDISGNAKANSLVQAETRTSTDKFLLEIKNQTIQKGDLVTVPIYANNLAAIEGYQFTLNFDKLDFINLEEGIAKSVNFGLSNTDRGYINTSWNTLTSAPTTDSKSSTLTNQQAKREALFQLTFKAQQSGQLHQFLQIGSALTAEAYRKDGSIMEVAIQQNSTSIQEFTLYQNQPNPFKTATTIRFDLPEASEVSLKVLDMQGRIQHQETTDFAKGVQVFHLNKNLPAGTYLYQLATPFGTQTRKMLIVN